MVTRNQVIEIVDDIVNFEYNSRSGRERGPMKKKPRKLIGLIYDILQSGQKTAWMKYVKVLKSKYGITISYESLKPVIDCVAVNKDFSFRPLNRDHFDTRYNDFAKIINGIFNK